MKMRKIGLVCAVIGFLAANINSAAVAFPARNLFTSPDLQTDGLRAQPVAHKHYHNKRRHSHSHGKYRHRHKYDPRYYGHRYRYRRPGFQYYFGGWWYAEPWWYYSTPRYYYNRHVRWCLGRYRSYDPSTDMFLGFDGYYHRCRSPYRP